MEKDKIIELLPNEAISINGGSLHYTIRMLINDIINGFTAWI